MLSMINGNLEQFLDTGWWNGDATIYYNEHIYFLDGYFDKEKNIHLRIMKWKVKNVENRTFQNIYDDKGDLIDYSEIEMEASNEETMREKFLNAEVWDGKSFWEVEKELAWLDW